MCDVLVALPDSTARGNVVFAKNSDRPARECQPLSSYDPAGRRRPGNTIRCSYIQIPDANRVLPTFGCRPYWCWGYETGMNAAGVAGGNLAVFTRARQAARDATPGLTGMDLLRLGLERGETAERAVDVIVALLEQYGQWGSAVGGKDHEAGGYDNSFLLADRREAWVLETAGRRWAAERITSGVRTLSNELSIRQRFTRSSGDLARYASAQGWHSGGEGDVDFALAYSDHEHYARQVAHIRAMRSRELLHLAQGKIDAATMMRALRDHYEDTFLDGPQFHQFLPDFLTLCMHDSPAGFTWGNTATSVVVELELNSTAPPPFWLCYLPPCCGLYIAYALGAPVPESVMAAGEAGLEVRQPRTAPADTFRASSLWWRFQRIYDAVAQKPAERHPELRAALDPVEAEFLNTVRAGPADWPAFVGREVETAEAILSQLEERWQLNS